MAHKIYKTKPAGVLCFPGTQCDEDVVKAIKSLNYTVKKIRHTDRFSPQNYSAFILPGGFSYGDYLRAGALAGHSPALQDIHTAARQGKPVLGICNGFQILCEAGLLEGTLQINNTLRFIDKWVKLKLCHSCAAWGGDQIAGTFSIPIAHKEGRFYADEEQMKKLKDQGRIWLKYTHNPNGSLENIAGIMNEKKNVAGLMPHPERAMADWMGGTAGRAFFTQFQ